MATDESREHRGLLAKTPALGLGGLAESEMLKEEEGHLGEGTGQANCVKKKLWSRDSVEPS